MKTLLLLLLLLHGAAAVKHTLTYFQTLTSGPINFPEYVGYVLVDGVWIFQYDSNTRRLEPRQDWMNTFIAENQNYWQKTLQRNQRSDKSFVEELKQRFNQTGGVHTLQWKHGCEWDDKTGRTDGFRHFAYDGEDFISLDLKNLRWVAHKPEALVTTDQWNNRDLHCWKWYFDYDCIECLKRYLRYGGASLHRTGPFPPSSIEAVMDNEIHIANVSWNPGVRAVSYFAEIRASSGHRVNCSAHYTHCHLTSLQCGEEYEVTVTSVGETSNSTAHMAGYLTTGPCVPTNLSVHYYLSNAMVRWEVTRGVSSYAVQAVSNQALTVTCTTTSTQCTLTGLQCGQIYKVTVTAHNTACSTSEASETYNLMTEPCPPTNVESTVDCVTVGYVAYVDNQNGHCMSCVCTAGDSSCAVSGLMCGMDYYVRVKAVGQQYNSSDSAMISMTSAPCPPTEVEVKVDCDADGAAVVSWTPGYGVANITVAVGGSPPALCKTQQNSCKVTALGCGQTYNLSLTASNEQCSLKAPAHANLATRPCPPQHVAVDLQCDSGTAVLSWERRTDVDLYVAKVTTSEGETRRRSSTDDYSHFSGLTCMEVYNFTVAAHSHGCYSRDTDTVFQTAASPVRLVNSNNRCSGRVEVYHDGRWGSVCDDSWDLSDANVVCRQLGCGMARPAPQGASFGQGRGPISLDDVNCSGNEASITDCSHQRFGVHDCHHGKDASVICEDTLLETSQLICGQA